MELTKEEKDSFKGDVKAQFLAEVKRRIIERIFFEQKDRLENYFARMSNELAEDIKTDFPL